MAGRIRTIKPETIEDEAAASLSDPAWRTWVSMWVLADDFGNCRAGDRYLAAQIWQDTGARLQCAADALLELAKRGFVTAYECHGQRYARINGFSKHQRTDNAGKRRVPYIGDGESVTLLVVRGRFSASAQGACEARGEPGGEGQDSPPRARAPSPTTDHRPPTTDQDPARHAAPDGYEETTSSDTPDTTDDATDAPCDAPSEELADVADGQESEKQAKKPPLPFRVDAAVAEVQKHANGRFMAPEKVLRGHTITIEAVIRQYPRLEQWAELGKWIAAGGPDRRSIVDICALAKGCGGWFPFVASWCKGGRGPVSASPTNGHSRSDPARGRVGVADFTLVTPGEQR